MYLRMCIVLLCVIVLRFKFTILYCIRIFHLHAVCTTNSATKHILRRSMAIYQYAY